MELIVVVGLLIAGIVWWSVAATAAKRKKLLAKYEDREIVDRIMRRVIWQGMNYEQLIDSRGRPADIDEKIYKTKTVHIFKYDADGRRSFRTRITIENGAVVGWTIR